MIVWCNGDNLFHNVVIYLMLFFEDNFKLNFYSFGEIQYLLYVKKSFMVAYLFPEHKLLLELVVRLDFLCWPRAEIARTNVALCCSAPGYLPTYYCRSQNPLVPLGSIYVHTNTITHARTHAHAYSAQTCAGKHAYAAQTVQSSLLHLVFICVPISVCQTVPMRQWVCLK